MDNNLFKRSFFLTPSPSTTRLNRLLSIMVRGKGKWGKIVRGGGPHYSKGLGREGIDEGEEGDGKELRGENGSGDSEEGSEEGGEGSSEEEGSSEDEAGTSATAQPELTRQQKRDLKKKQAEEMKKLAEEDPDLINPNHVQQKKIDLNAPIELSRRDREQKEKREAKERYWKLHVQGKTDEAKADLSRLQKVRAEREAAQAKRKAEAEAKAAEVEAKKKAQLAKRTT